MYEVIVIRIIRHTEIFQPDREFELTDLSPPDTKCSLTSNIFATARRSHFPCHFYQGEWSPEMWLICSFLSCSLMMRGFFLHSHYLQNSQKQNILWQRSQRTWWP
jgi:hypothetical protein